MTTATLPDSAKPVLVLVEVLEVLDAAFVSDYQRAIGPQMAKRGARNLAVGLETVIGQSDAINMVVSLWPSAETYVDWQRSAEYAPWGDHRKAALRVRTDFIPLLPGIVLSDQGAAS